MPGRLGLAVLSDPGLSLLAWRFFYSGEAIEATVIDAETGAPIEEVNVAARWELRIGGLVGETFARVLHAAESKTNKDGRFAFAPWWPSIALTSHLYQGDPTLFLGRIREREQCGSPIEKIDWDSMLS